MSSFNPGSQSSQESEKLAPAMLVPGCGGAWRAWRTARTSSTRQPRCPSRGRVHSQTPEVLPAVQVPPSTSGARRVTDRAKSKRQRRGGAKRCSEPAPETPLLAKQCRGCRLIKLTLSVFAVPFVRKGTAILVPFWEEGRPRPQESARNVPSNGGARVPRN